MSQHIFHFGSNNGELKMDKLRAMQLFTRVVATGSFAAAAHELNSTPSMVSKEIRKLEDNIGARLLHRTTRNLQLTPIGEGYLERCHEIISQVHNADAYIQQVQQNLTGKLRINAPMTLGLTHLSRFFADFMLAYPNAELDIHLGDENLDLVEHGFDLAFRASSQAFDSNYIGKTLQTFDYRICAAPQYLATRDIIDSPAALQHHNCFVYSYFQGRNEWPVADGIRIQGNLQVNNTLFIREAVEAGLGVGFLPSFVADPSLEAGRLIEVLPDTPKPQLTLYALYPNRQHVPPILAKCITFLDQWF